MRVRTRPFLSSALNSPAPHPHPDAVQCDDGDRATTSSGDPRTHTVIFNLDPGETVGCTFMNARRGTIVAAPEVLPSAGPNRHLSNSTLQPPFPHR
ncbi:MAG: hypothetical protein U9R72_14110 [Chloroflexota bacterium]|nr:hypothetical protein [Chloroflexota bacterium]MEA3377321.1 hypothetical protein [Chloroflexota bacterium]